MRWSKPKPAPLGQGIKQNSIDDAMRALGLCDKHIALINDRVLATMDTVAEIRRDPFSFARDNKIGFATADAIAREIGIKPDDIRRTAAIARIALNEYINRTGDTIATAEQIAHASRHRDDGLAERIAQIDHPALIRLGGDVMTSQMQAQMDADIAAFITDLAHAAPRQADPSSISRAERQAGITLNAQQRSAVTSMLGRRIAIMTGGPGTGKTTTLSVLINAMAGKRIRLAAPTGRAAQRMSEQTGIPATTLHRMLGDHIRNEPGQPKREAPIDTADIIVVDEMSMVDSMMMAGIARSIPAHASLMLIGDPDQLPSIGAGAVLRDLIASGAIAVNRLLTIQRQAANSPIIVNAARINAGNADLMDTAAFRFIETTSDEDSAIAAIKAASTTGDVRMLSAIKRTPAGVFALNAAMQTRKLGRIRRDEPTLRCQAQDWTWRVGDPVLHTKNDTALGLVNGEAGEVVGISVDGLTIEVDYPGRDEPVSYRRDPEIRIIPAYAMTIHKSQGSEYAKIVMTLPQNASSFISRMMIYTAITRAKSEVVIVGSRAALNAAIANDHPARRNTCLPIFIDAARQVMAEAA
jgi:exodeoxyribonuclease V alpha subunit